MDNATKSRKDNTFRFKQFEVRNEVSAMKVNTDGVLLGAWIPSAGYNKIWDVGCGTGVIALMLAQRFPDATITGIEIDCLSAEEARANFERSEWGSRLSVVNADFAAVHPSLPVPDLIVCNPPFFDETKHNLVSPEMRKQRARHEGSLSYESLMNAASGLNDDCRLCFISPADRENDIEYAASFHRLHIERKTFVRTREQKSPRRILWCLAKKPCPTLVDTLTLRDSNNEYTPEYRKLVNDFYL